MIQLNKKQKASVFTFIVMSLVLVAATFIEPKEVEIGNGIITARLYLPDTINGYYKGVRFDWSGIFEELNCSGHSYYGDWYMTKYKPTNDDAVMGPAEAFDPIGYNEAGTGGSFLKIGVGILTKPDDSVYKFTHLYTVTNPGKWKVSVKTNQVKFVQTLKDTAYSYIYQKTVELVKNRPIMILSHKLKNTGKRIIETSVFDHNFLVMDNQPTGPGFSLTFPFSLNNVPNKKPDFIQLKDNQLTFLKTVDKRPVSILDLTNGNDTAVYDFKVENHNTGAAVRVTADKPVLKMPFWASPKSICPEPYIKIKINPGEEVSWNITYQYYTCDITKQTTGN